MFIPLTITIFSGALSPSCLEGQRYVSERLQQSTRKLMNLPGSLDGLTDQLKEILSDWQVDLPVPSFLFPLRPLFPTLMPQLFSAACG